MISKLPPHVGPETTRSPLCQYQPVSCSVGTSLSSVATSSHEPSKSRERLNGCQLDCVAGEQGAAKRRKRHGMHATGAREVHEGRSSVVPNDAQVPEVVEKVRVVAVAEEARRVRRDDLGIQVGENGDLVTATNRGQDGLDRVVGKRVREIARTVFRRGVELTRRGIFDRYQIELLAYDAQTDLVDLGKDGRRGPGGRKDGDPIARADRWRRAKEASKEKTALSRTQSLKRSRREDKKVLVRAGKSAGRISVWRAWPFSRITPRPSISPGPGTAGG